MRDGLSLGDAWHYEPFGEGPQAIVPFHKLSQWLTYSLVETLLRSRIEVTHVDRLTGLPEYRNGGLLYEFNKESTVLSFIYLNLTIVCECIQVFFSIQRSHTTCTG